MKKKILSIIIGFLMVMALVGCSGDTVAPVLSNYKDYVYQVGGDIPNYKSGVEALDNVDGDITNKITVDDSGVNYEVPGNYEVTLSVTDEAGNIATITINVQVKLPSKPDLSVRNASGSNGMVATASGYASEVGLQILQAGGNAFDAAVAIGFALGVVEPNASGIGGGGFMVGYKNSSQKAVSYNYREFAPGLTDVELYNSGQLVLDDTVGGFGIPMLVDGLLTVLEEEGTMSLEEVLRPSVNLARYGFPVTSTLAEAISGNFAKLMRDGAVDEALEIYSNDGISALTEDEILTNPNLANVYEKIIAEGKDGFYKGDVARAIIQAVRAEGAVATMADMSEAIDRTKTVNAADPLHGTYKNFDVITMPTPTNGVVVIEALNMLEHFDKTTKISEMVHNSAEYLHVVGSATQLAFGDRRKYVADEKFENVPMEGLMSKEYAAERWEAFDPNQGVIFSTIGKEFGNPNDFQTDTDALLEGTESYSTTHYVVVDKDYNVVSATHTINKFFGCGIIPDGTGIILNNTMTPLSKNVNSVHLIKPYKQPQANIAPTILLKDGEPYLAIGSPGSMRICSAIIQTVLNVVEFGMDIQTAINSPRIHSYVGADPEIEGAVGLATIAGLRALGYNFGTVDKPKNVYNGINLYFGGVQGIVIDGTNSVLYGGADPRRDGKALGY